MGSERNERDGEIHSLAYERNRRFHFNGEQVEERNQTKNRILLKGVLRDFKGEEDPLSDRDSPRR